MAAKFKITYATLAADNEELQSSFDRALETVRGQWLGADVPMFLAGDLLYTEDKLESRSPIDTDLLLCTAQQGDASYTDRAVAAAQRAFPLWSATPWQERASIIRKIAEQISDDIFELSALMSLEVGKSRLESLGQTDGRLRDRQRFRPAGQPEFSCRRVGRKMGRSESRETALHGGGGLVTGQRSRFGRE